jgi:2-oxoglutarate dehydrogenase E1 component
MKDFQYITNSHPAFIEGLYKDYVNNPESIDNDLRKFFDGFDFAYTSGGAVGNKTTANGASASASADIDWIKEIRAYRMILGYRNKGHLLAKTNPIRKRKDRGANIELEFYGFTDADLDTVYNAGNLIGLGPTTLRNIQAYLENVMQSMWASNLNT